MMYVEWLCLPICLHIMGGSYEDPRELEYDFLSRVSNFGVWKRSTIITSSLKHCVLSRRVRLMIGKINLSLPISADITCNLFRHHFESPCTSLRRGHPKEWHTWEREDPFSWERTRTTIAINRTNGVRNSFADDGARRKLHYPSPQQVSFHPSCFYFICERPPILLVLVGVLLFVEISWLDICCLLL